MSFKSLNDPFDPAKSITHEKGCTCSSCQPTDTVHFDGSLANKPSASAPGPASSEEIMDRAIESAVVR